MAEKEKERYMQQTWQSINTANVKSAQINLKKKHTHITIRKTFVFLEKTSECPSNADKYWRVSPPLLFCVGFFF